MLDQLSEAVLPEADVSLKTDVSGQLLELATALAPLPDQATTLSTVAAARQRLDAATNERERLGALEDLTVRRGTRSARSLTTRLVPALSAERAPTPAL
jgi:hypothetical protein